VDTLFRQPGALDSVQRPWPTVEAAILAAIERAESEVSVHRLPPSLLGTFTHDGNQLVGKGDYIWDFPLPPGAAPACDESPGAVRYKGYGVSFSE
jgi:hypothetical protein